MKHTDRVIQGVVDSIQVMAFVLCFNFSNVVSIILSPYRLGALFHFAVPIA